MDIDMVWRVADYARGAANTGPAWADAAAEVLAILEPDEIVAFGACAAALAAALDTPAVRAAARPLVAANDEADFAAFRLWVVGRGREFYDAVRGGVGLPESPAWAGYDPYAGDLQSAARVAYRARTGRPAPGTGIRA